MKYSLDERVKLYNGAFPKYPSMWYDKNWLLGIWNIGNNYKGSGYHGAYPPSYLKRIHSLFPDIASCRTMNLFSGSLGKLDRGIKIDINPDLGPDVCCNAEEMSKHVKNNYYDLILADPPYSEEDALRYGNPMVNRNKVVKEAHKVLRKGGYLCWMDMVLPMYRKDEFKRVGEIAISRSTNHRVRAVFIFEKV
jgi:hypothetical protein